MLDVRGSIENLAWNTEHHFLHIKTQHPFIRIWAVQFELGYSDFRTIQLALQLAEKTDLLKRFTTAYNEVYQYEYAFVKGDIEGFNETYGDKIDDYMTAHQELLASIEEIKTFQPAIDPSEGKLI